MTDNGTLEKKPTVIVENTMTEQELVQFLIERAKEQGYTIQAGIFAKGGIQKYTNEYINDALQGHTLNWVVKKIK